jgi:hypothetical protein
MVLLFSSLSKSYAKNGGIAKGPYIFEPLVTFVTKLLFLILRENYKDT